ncbi:class I SAM-dependent methyltransferase [Macromonas nakdongensis]|uniref:class I SAM-dependent methyltransferase n=1 Tax=Macromonas nakdongensis TaxID=1843082 RepID=UPI000C31EB1B|nr:class I SAM-dependent methyltransferase [Macromonas nakdongensis]
MTPPHTSLSPSDWVCRWTHLIPDQRPGGPRALDLACGHGRHSRWLVRQGCHVTAVDRDANALATLADLAPRVRTVAADVENGPWPLSGQAFDAVIVTNYLWRPLWPQILASLAPGGVLIYETFADGNATVGKPSRPDFLLQPGELLRLCAGLRTVAYEDGFLTAPERFVQRIVAVRETLPPPDAPHRYTLRAAG